VLLSGSVFTDVSISSKISNEVASQISIAAQGSAQNYSENVETLLKWNEGVIDRVRRTKDTSNTGKDGVQAVEDDRAKREAKWIDTLKTFFEDFNGSGYDEEDMKTAKTMHAEWTLENVLKKGRTQKKEPLPGTVPVELSFKTTGIGGFRPLEAFKISAGILPSKYQDRFGYIITGLEHSIDSKNQWETSVTTQFYSIDKPSDLETQAAGQPPGVTKREVLNKKVTEDRKDDTPKKPVDASKTKGGTSRTIKGVTYKNGQVPDDKMRALANWKKYLGSNQSDGGRLRMYVDAALAVDKLLVAADKAKVTFKVNSCYRSYEDQVRVKKQYGGLAATPGTSNHGFGLAIDFAYGGGAKLTPSTPQYKWLIENAATFGFKRLPYNPRHPESWEAWHWEYQI